MSEALRKAAEQALEALKCCSGVPHWPALVPVIDALKAALAEPEQAEPVGALWQHSETGRTRITQPGDITDCDASWFKAADLFAAPPRREPLTQTGEIVRERGGGLPWTVACADGKTRLLYPETPPRKPLTEEQIADIAINQKRPPPHDCCTVLLTGPGVDYKAFRSGGENGWVTLEDLILYTRAIEAAHGITGGKT